MSEIKIGDRVIFRHFKPEGEFGTVIEPTGTWKENIVQGELVVSLDSGSTYYTRPDELEIELPQFVNVVTSRSIWVTLPGDNAGHKLTEDEARALFRQLEEVI